MKLEHCFRNLPVPECVQRSLVIVQAVRADIQMFKVQIPIGHVMHKIDSPRVRKLVQEGADNAYLFTVDLIGFQADGRPFATHAEQYKCGTTS